MWRRNVPVQHPSAESCANLLVRDLIIMKLLMTRNVRIDNHFAEYSGLAEGQRKLTLDSRAANPVPPVSARFQLAVWGKKWRSALT